MDPRAIVIVGSGLAGTAVAREVRKLDPQVPITLVTADAGEVYAKPNCSNALAQGRSADQLVQGTAETTAKSLQIALRTRTRVTAIDRPGHRLLTDQGEIPFGRLVLALGAKAIDPRLSGDGQDRVFSVNSLDDYRRFRHHLGGTQSVAVLGAGLVGCEFADDLRSSGIAVTVFDPGSHPLGRLLPARTGAYVAQRLESAGIRLVRTGLTRVEHDGNHLVVSDTAGNHHGVDLVLSAIGLRPDLTLAQDAGLAVDRGIVVDRHLQTSDPDIFALGDCAQVAGLVLPFIQPILHAAKALAKNLTGSPTDLLYPAMPVVVKTPSCPLVVCPPPLGRTGTWEEDETLNGVKALYRDDTGTALGFALAGDVVPQRNALGATMPPWLA